MGVGTDTCLPVCNVERGRQKGREVIEMQACVLGGCWLGLPCLCISVSPPSPDVVCVSIAVHRHPIIHHTHDA